MQRQNSNIKQIPDFISELKNYKSNTIDKITSENSLDALIYGIPCILLEKKQNNIGYLYASEVFVNALHFAIPGKDDVRKINLSHVQKISFNEESENLKYHKKAYATEKYIQIYVEKTQLDFVFFNLQYFELFIKGVLSLYDYYINLDKNNIYYQLKVIAKEFDKNFDNEIDNDEFEDLALQLGYDPEYLLYELDINSDGKISHSEIMKYFKNQTSGFQFRELFEKYASIMEGGEKLINAKDLQRFFNEEQKENIS